MICQLNNSAAVSSVSAWTMNRPVSGSMSMLTVPGVIVMQFAKSTLPQWLSMGGLMTTNTGPTGGLDSKMVLATAILDWMINRIRVRRQWPKSSSSSRDSKWGSLGPSSCQNQTVKADSTAPTKRWSRSTSAEIANQNASSKAHRIRDRLRTENPLRGCIRC